MTRLHDPGCMTLPEPAHREAGWKRDEHGGLFRGLAEGIRDEAGGAELGAEAVHGLGPEAEIGAFRGDVGAGGAAAAAIDAEHMGMEKDDAAGAVKRVEAAQDVLGLAGGGWRRGEAAFQRMAFKHLALKHSALKHVGGPEPGGFGCGEWRRAHGL